MGNREPEKLTGKTVIVIDDGIATGNTLLATIQVLKKANPAKIIIAVPVASEQAAEKLAEVADVFVAIHIPDVFYGVGAFYEDFSQVSDDEVLHFLEKWQEEFTARRQA